MTQMIQQALKNYYTQWDNLVATQLTAVLRPTAIGWKVADESEYHKQYTVLRSGCDKVVETWMNGRWIAKMHLKNSVLQGDIEIVKLMQRRPGSEDSLGLDHVDFMCQDIKQIEALLNKSDLKWSWESNDIIDSYNWISIWFAGTEAKIKQDTVLDIVIQELQELNQRITR